MPSSAAEHSWCAGLDGFATRAAAEIVTLDLILCLAEMRFSFGFFTGTRLFALSLHTLPSQADVPTALHLSHAIRCGCSRVTARTSGSSAQHGLCAVLFATSLPAAVLARANVCGGIAFGFGTAQL